MARSKALTFLLFSLAAVHCRAGCQGGELHNCAECPGGSWNSANEQCTKCEPGYNLHEHSWGEDSCIWEGCNWSDDYIRDWYAKMLVGSIVGGIIALVTTIVTSLPVCCGVMKDGPLKPIAIVCCVIAGICLFIPAISGLVAAGSVTDDICNACGGCNDADKQDIQGHFSGGSVILAYIWAFGFVAVILGSITMCFSCCMCCPCCGPLQQAKQAQQESAGQLGCCGGPGDRHIERQTDRHHTHGQSQSRVQSPHLRWERADGLRDRQAKFCDAGLRNIEDSNLTIEEAQKDDAGCLGCGCA